MQNPNTLFTMALQKLQDRLLRENVHLDRVKRITLNQVTNRDTGKHVHAHCSVQVNYDEMVSEKSTSEPVYSKTMKDF